MAAIPQGTSCAAASYGTSLGRKHSTATSIYTCHAQPSCSTRSQAQARPYPQTVLQFAANTAPSITTEKAHKPRAAVIHPQVRTYLYQHYTLRYNIHHTVIHVQVDTSCCRYSPHPHGRRRVWPCHAPRPRPAPTQQWVVRRRASGRVTARRRAPP